MPDIQTGMILLWSGAIVDIPPGYSLCDGNNGTPDLRDRFVIGAGNTYAVDASGGTVNHTHTFTTNGHQHALPFGNDFAYGSGVDDFSAIETDTGTTDPSSLLPLYYALAYIMKL